MPTTPLGGPIQLQDPATGGAVSATVTGTATYQVLRPGAEAMLPQLQAALLRATGLVVGQKLSANQVAIPTLPQSMPYFHGEIVAMSGAEAMGFRVESLTLDVQVAAAAAAPLPGAGGPLPPDPIQATKNALAARAAERLDPSNYNVSARVNVGGFRVKASTDGGLDTDSLKEQVKDKAKSTVMWWAIGCGVMGFVALLLCGLGGYIYVKAKDGVTSATSATASPSWDGTTPLTCGGVQHVRVEGVTATFATGTAVSAGANCHVELVRCTITAPVALEAAGNASITVEGGSITGTEAAARATGNGSIALSGGAALNGPSTRLGNGTITGP